MIPRSHPMDAQNRAQDLVSTILAASTPSQIAAACSSIDSFLTRLASDQCRAFFSIAFPVLVRRLFGFEDARSPSPPSGWIDQSITDPSPDLASRLFSFLAPSSPLFSSISSIDRHALVRYVFPLERLPEWMRIAIQNERYVPVLPDLCPLFKGRVKEDNVQGSYQLQLNVFEYYIFWFAYYPVCRGNSQSSDSGTVKKIGRFRLENWTSSLPVLAAVSRRSAQKTESSLYLRLLYAYLHASVPKCGLGSQQPYRSSLLHYSSTWDNSGFMQAEFLVYALIHFWMIDNDFSPLPVSLSCSFDITFPYRAVSEETPPTAGLGDSVKLLVKYLNSGLTAPAEGRGKMVFGGSPVWKGSGLEGVAMSTAVMVSLDNSFGLWNSVMQRPLYRFILRTFLFCPMGASMKNAMQVFSLWTGYIRPWRITPEDFNEFEIPGGQHLVGSRKEKTPTQVKSKEEDKGGSQLEAVYTLVWEDYVLSNYLFYSSLVVHFFGFAHKFLHANVESMIQMVSELLHILTSSKELLDLLLKTDVAYQSKSPGSSSSHYGSVYKYMPSIRQQMQDWEAGLCESDADGSFLHENQGRDLKLFSDAEEGAHKLLQLFVLRAEHEIQNIPGDVSQNLKDLDSIRCQINILFGGPVRFSQPPDSPKEAHALPHGRAEAFTPNHPGFGKRRWVDEKFEGDWMRRPISDTEVAWLARLLIRSSDWLNEALGFNRADGCNDSAGLVFVNEARDEAGHVVGPKELLLTGRDFVVRFLRGLGMRINLRVLASKKFVMILVVYAAFCALKKAFQAVLVISGFQ